MHVIEQAVRRAGAKVQRCRLVQRGAEIQQRFTRGAEVVQVLVQVQVWVQCRCTAGAQQVHSRCTAGAQQVQRRCRGAEVHVQRCKGAEVQTRCRRGAGAGAGAEVLQRFCRGSTEVQQVFNSFNWGAEQVQM